MYVVLILFVLSFGCSSCVWVEDESGNILVIVNDERTSYQLREVRAHKDLTITCSFTSPFFFFLVSS